MKMSIMPGNKKNCISGDYPLPLNFSSLMFKHHVIILHDYDVPRSTVVMIVSGRVHDASY